MNEQNLGNPFIFAQKSQMKQLPEQFQCLLSCNSIILNYFYIKHTHMFSVQTNAEKTIRESHITARTVPFMSSP